MGRHVNVTSLLFTIFGHVVTLCSERNWQILCIVSVQLEAAIFLPKCVKTHLQQSQISKFSRGETPEPPFVCGGADADVLR